MLGRVWSARTAEPLGPPVPLHDPRVEDRGASSFEPLFTPDGKRMLVVNYGMMGRYYTRMSIRVFDARTLEFLGGDFAHHHPDEGFEYAVSPDRTKILTLRGIPFTGKSNSEENWPKGGAIPASGTR